MGSLGTAPQFFYGANEHVHVANERFHVANGQNCSKDARQMPPLPCFIRLVG